MPDLFDSLTVKTWTLPNRLVMAPLTRNRADGDGVPGDLAVEYYAQRASAGPDHHRGHPAQRRRPGLPRTPPGLHTAEQVAGWRRVADAVHARGGRIVAQLMHAGRVAHPDNKGGHESVAPSALAAPERDVHRRRHEAAPRPRARWRPTRSPASSRSSSRPPATRSPPASTASRSTPPTATCSTSSSRRAPTSATDEYGGSPGRTGPASRSRSPGPSPRRSAPTGSASGSRPPTTSRAPPRSDPADVEATYTALVEAHRAARPGLPQRPRRPAPATLVAATCASASAASVIANDGFGDGHHPRDGAGDPRRGPRRRGRRRPALPGQPRPAAPLAAPAPTLNEPDPATFYGGGAEGYTDVPELDESPAEPAIH